MRRRHPPSLCGGGPRDPEAAGCSSSEAIRYAIKLNEREFLLDSYARKTVAPVFVSPWKHQPRSSADLPALCPDLQHVVRAACNQGADDDADESEDGGGHSAALIER
jgi:hypothetical protein